MTKRIVAATDLSDESDEALRQAHARAAATGAELAVCHVLPRLVGVNVLFPQRQADNAVKMATFERDVSDAVARQISACIPDAKPTIVIEQGADYAAIVKYAETWRADLVVVGSRGRTGMPRLSLGSVAERVVRHAHCPVLVARAPSKRGTVLVATDLSDPSMPAIAAGAEEARARGAQLVVVHAIEFGSLELTLEEIVEDVTRRGAGWNVDDNIRKTAEDDVRRALAHFGVEGEARVVDGAPAAAVVREADRSGAELIVVGTRGRTGLVRIALGSTAERIIRGAQCSVLAVRLGGS